jgi:hypothetical protein
MVIMDELHNNFIPTIFYYLLNLVEHVLLFHLNPLPLFSPFDFHRTSQIRYDPTPSTRSVGPENFVSFGLLPLASASSSSLSLSPARTHPPPPLPHPQARASSCRRGGAELLRYLEAFTRLFDLHWLVRFETEVVRIRREPGSEWAVALRKLGEKGSSEEEVYDAVVDCIRSIPLLRCLVIFASRTAATPGPRRRHADGNKSLYLVFVGVVFLSILDCF